MKTLTSFPTTFRFNFLRIPLLYVKDRDVIMKNKNKHFYNGRLVRSNDGNVEIEIVDTSIVPEIELISIHRIIKYTGESFTAFEFFNGEHFNFFSVLANKKAMIAISSNGIEAIEGNIEDVSDEIEIWKRIGKWVL